MTETTAEWAVTPPADPSSDTDSKAEASVFTAELPDQAPPSGDRSVGRRSEDRRSARSGAESTSSAEIDAAQAHVDDVTEELEARVEAEADGAKSVLDPRRLIKEHPVLAGVLAVGVIGIGVVGYRFVRSSLPVRLYLALRFGRWRELIPG